MGIRTKPLGFGALLLLACSPACTSKDPLAFEALVSIGAGATANCMNVAVWSTPDAKTFSNNFRNSDAGSYAVAVFQGNLPADVSVEAFGYVDSSCGALVSESGPSPATFGLTQSVGLTLFALPPQDAGTDGGSGSDAGGSTDAGGTPDAGGGPDSGSGMDAGTFSDAGADAGPSCLALSWDGGYAPSNFDPAAVPCVNPPLVIDCNPSTVVDTTGFSGTAPLAICGRPEMATLRNQLDGGNVKVVVVASAGLTVLADSGITLAGPYPVVFAVYGNAEVDGTLRAPGGADGGPGADLDARCNAVSGSGTGGGGGGGFGQGGGNGGEGGGNGGNNFGGVNPLAPLQGGCSGASGDPTNGGLSGGAGGAIQISAANLLKVTGTIAAAGAGGTGGTANHAGGAGGGSGGGILLEAWRVSLEFNGTKPGALTVNGGGGGAGGDGSGSGGSGNPGSETTGTAATGGQPAGMAGSGGNGGASGGAQGGMSGSGSGGGGGGGGGVGYIYINANSCNLASGTVRSGVYNSGHFGPGGGGC